MVNPVWLAFGYGVSEMAIAMVLRSKSESSATDRGSLRILMIVINASVFCAIFASFYLRDMHFGSTGLYWTGILVFAAGLMLRWYSIVSLGRFFTVDVAVAADQHVIDTGPYRFVRHPRRVARVLWLRLVLCQCGHAVPAGSTDHCGICVSHPCRRTGITSWVGRAIQAIHAAYKAADPIFVLKHFRWGERLL